MVSVVPADAGVSVVLLCLRDNIEAVVSHGFVTDGNVVGRSSDDGGGVVAESSLEKLFARQ